MEVVEGDGIWSLCFWLVGRFTSEEKAGFFVS